MNILWKSFVLFQKKIRDEKIMLFEDLYTEFSKLKLTRFYSAKTNTLYHGKSFSKDNFEEMIKVAMTRKYKTLKKRKRNLINIDTNDDFLTSAVKNQVFNDISQRYDYIANYYDRKDNINFVLTNEEDFMSSFYWKRIHQLLTSSLFNNDSKYRIYQVKEDNSLFKYIESNTTTEEKKLYIKESRFSYIRPIQGSTRLIIYNSSNVTSMEGQVHRGSKVVVEVPEGSIIVFTNDTFHAGVKAM